MGEYSIHGFCSLTKTKILLVFKEKNPMVAVSEPDVS